MRHARRGGGLGRCRARRRLLSCELLEDRCLLSAGDPAASLVPSDPLPLLSVSDAAINEGDSGTRILEFTVTLSTASDTPVTVQYATGVPTALEFFGNGGDQIDRLIIPLDDPARPVDVGAADFTIEWWMKADAAGNTGTVTTAADGWQTGNVIFDRDVWGPGDFGDFGISLGDGRIAFGVNNGSTGVTIVGAANVADNQWHHVAVTRRFSDGMLSIYVDGKLDAQGLGPTGDISYRDGRDASLPNDPYLVIGAEKHDSGPTFPSYTGLIDELRVSDILRYERNFLPLLDPFVTDARTVGLYHFDEGAGVDVRDVSLAAGGPSNGTLLVGGSPAGPLWTTDTPFYAATPGVDFITARGTLVFNPGGPLTQTVQVTILSDTLAEPDERFVLRLFAATGAALAKAEGLATIVNDDMPTLTVTQLLTAADFPATPNGRLIDFADPRDGSGRLFIYEQGAPASNTNATARIWIYQNGSILSTPFLTLTGVNRSGNEEGLLGMAFHPDFATPGAAGQGKFYVYYSVADPRRSVVSEFTVSAGNPNLADPLSERILLEFSQPQSNHNGGELAFGPDGYLYIGSGDGGGSDDNDSGHTAGTGNAQDLTNLLGKILRIDVNGDDFPADPLRNYRIPADNPFVDLGGGVRPEIFAYGLRNPFRFAFDIGPAGARLFVGDVGQNLWEEVDIVVSGGNYGWRKFEGFVVNSVNAGDALQAEATIFPIAVYPNPTTAQAAIIGGEVYRGRLFPELYGKYIFADFLGQVYALQENPDAPTGWDLLTPTIVGGNPIGQVISGFGIDSDGEIYFTTGVNGSTSRLYRLGVANSPPLVQAVYVSGSSWSDPFLDYLAAQGLGDAAQGFHVSSGASQLDTLPWLNVNRITVIFSEHVSVTAGSLVLVGSPDLAPPPDPSGFSYDAATKTAIWQFAAPLTFNKYLLHLDDTLLDVGGLALDGEWTDSVSTNRSGDGAAGGDFNFRLNLLPADANNSRSVTFSEIGTMRSMVGLSTQLPGYDPRFDVDGSGSITFGEVGQARNRVGPGIDILSDPSAPPSAEPPDEFAPAQSWEFQADQTAEQSPDSAALFDTASSDSSDGGSQALTLFGLFTSGSGDDPALLPPQPGIDDPLAEPDWSAETSDEAYIDPQPWLLVPLDDDPLAVDEALAHWADEQPPPEGDDTW